MQELFKKIKQSDYIQKIKEKQRNHFRGVCLWCIWILSLVQFILKSPDDQLPSGISQNSLKMLEIIKTNKLFDYVSTKMKENKDLLYELTCEYPYINPEIFLSQKEKNKIDTRLYLFVLSSLYQFKCNFLTEGSHVIYYDHFKLFFKTLAKNLKFKLKRLSNPFPPLPKICNPETKGTDDHLLEQNIDYSLFDIWVTEIIKKSKHQSKTNNSKGEGKNSQPVGDTFHFLKIFLYYFHLIPWTNEEIYTNIHNRIICYHLSMVYLLFLTGPLSGQRDLYNVLLKLFTSDLLIYVDDESYEDVDEIEEFMENEQDPKHIGILKLVESFLIKNPNEKNKNIKKIVQHFILKNNRENLNKNNNKFKGFMTSTSINHITEKLISTTKSPKSLCKLVCGHNLGNTDETCQSPFLCDNELPFPCNLCSALRVCTFFIYHIHYNSSLKTIKHFHEWLEREQLIHDETNLSYFLEMDSDGNFTGETIETGETKMYLPIINEKTNEIKFEKLDPGRWVVETVSKGHLNINKEKITFSKLFYKHTKKYPNFCKLWFPNKSSFEWFKNVQTKLDEFNFGCYSLRALITYYSNKNQIPTYLSRNFFNWQKPKSDTQNTSYHHKNDQRNDPMFQIDFQILLYVNLLSKNTSHLEKLIDMMKRKPMKEILKKYHPLQKQD